MPEEEFNQDKFEENGMGGISFVRSICNHCIHVNADWQSCSAFPDGIPGEILTGEVKHTEEYEGDGGIQYEVNEMAL